MTWNYHFDFYCIYIVVGVVVINVYMEFQWFWEMHILILFFWVEVIWRLCKIFFIKICWYRDVDERRMIRSYLIWNCWIILIIQVICLGIVAMILINNCQKVFISSSSDINWSFNLNLSKILNKLVMKICIWIRFNFFLYRCSISFLKNKSNFV